MQNRLILFLRTFRITFLWGVVAAAVGGAIYGGLLYPLSLLLESPDSLGDVFNAIFMDGFFGGLFGIAFGIGGGVLDGFLIASLTSTILITPHQSAQKRWALRIASAAITMFVTWVGVTYFVRGRYDFFYVGLPLLIAGIGAWWVANRVIAAGQAKGKRKKNDGTLVEPIKPQMT